jgi:hypothetical protein
MIRLLDIIQKEKKGAFRARGGQLSVNYDGRITSGSANLDGWNRINQGRPYIGGTPVGLGRVQSIGGHNVTNKTSLDEANAMLNNCQDADEIHEMYATSFCKNENCRRSADTFVNDESRNESQCTKCGFTQKMASAKFSRSMNDQGVVDRSQYNHGPANAKLGDTVGCPRPASHTKPYHELNFIRIDKKIRRIADMFPIFAGLETIERSARAKLETFYHNTHPDNPDDNDLKMPHGGAAFAAACFYAATLEFEANPRRGGEKTPATLAVIRKFAQSELDKKYDHLGNCTTRDVTPRIIVRHTKLLGSLCQVEIPEYTAQSFLFTQDTSKKEHCRMALFKECGQPCKLFLPKKLPKNKNGQKQSFGFKIGDTGMGALSFYEVDENLTAYKQGFRDGDYILFFQAELVEATDTLVIFEKKMEKAMNERGLNLEFMIMRPFKTK